MNLPFYEQNHIDITDDFSDGITMEKAAKLSDQASSSAIGKVVVSYKSSNNKVATVSKSGKVTAKKAGTVTITTTIKLYTGATQVFKTKIVVK